MDELLNVVTVGHVDHGKSTVIGRMLADAGALPEGKLEAIQANCRRNSKPFEYAFLLDALKNEQAQGITIDTARCFFKTEKRNYILIDAPGHIEFLKNMVTGASRAEAALLVIDASRGVEENTRRHGYFLSMLGIRQVAVLVNKMDLVDYRQEVYEAIRTEYTAFLRKIHIEPEAFLPVSGVCGDNVAIPSTNMPWYTGNTVLQQLDAFHALPSAEKLPLRIPVQGVYKFTEGGDSRRIIAGQVEAGTLHAGDSIVFYPSGKTTTVDTLEVFNAETPAAVAAGEAASFTMREQIFVRRGEIAALAGQQPPKQGLHLVTNLFWLGKKPFSPDRRYHLKCGTAKVEMRLEQIRRIVNASNLDALDRDYVDKNEVAECVLTLEHPIAFDLAGQVDSTSRFVIVDGYEIAGGGIITDVLEDHDYNVRNIRWQQGALTQEERTRSMGHRGFVAWMTGLSGSGKTTLAQEAVRRLTEAGIHACVLDGDMLRRGLNKDLGFTDADREENIRRAAEVAKLFADSGMVVFVTLISPFAKSRADARSIIGDAFAEVFVKADLDTCIQRDPKQLYKKALSGGIPHFTGLDSPYEAPEKPDLLLDTDRQDEETCVQRLTTSVLALIRENNKE